MYLKRRDDGEEPTKTLRAFQRIAMKARDNQIVTIPLNYKSFEWFNPQPNTICITPGEFEILYGNSSRNEDLQSIKIKVE